MAALDAPIEWLEASRVVVPLAERISAPGVDVAEREFVVVRAAAGGEVGWGYGLTRGASLDDAVMRHLAPLVIGRPCGVHPCDLGRGAAFRGYARGVRHLCP